MGLNGELGGGINGPGESQGYIEAYKGASNTHQLHHPLLNLMPPTHLIVEKQVAVDKQAGSLESIVVTYLTALANHG